MTPISKLERLNMCMLLATILLLPGVAQLAAADEPRSPERWEKAVSEMEAKLAKRTPAPDTTLFIGSSSIRLWDLPGSFPALSTVNHGFGGSETSDAVHFFDRLVKPVQPARIVMYAGDNDIAKGKTPQQVHADFLAFTRLMREHLSPDTPLFYIAIKPSIKRWELREPMQQANNAIRKTCEDSASLHFVDIWAPMLGPDQTPRPELFAKDGLHLNDAGYRLWNTVLQRSFAAEDARSVPQPDR
jgi:lysophospholipase L1-like esterase